MHHLSTDETRATITKAQAGDRGAVDLLVRANQGLVHQVARFRHRSYTPTQLDDMLQEGNLGLLRAIQLFDLDAGTTLATYAHYWIDAYVRRAIDKAQLVSTSKDVRFYSLDQPIPSLSRDDPDDPPAVDSVPADLTPADQLLDSEQEQWLFFETLQRFRDVNGFVLAARLLEDRALEDVGAQLGVSREHIRQRELKLIPKFTQLFHYLMENLTMPGLASKSWKKCPRGCGHSIRGDSKYDVCYQCRHSDSLKQKRTEKLQEMREKPAWEKQLEEHSKHLPVVHGKRRADKHEAELDREITSTDEPQLPNRCAICRKRNTGEVDAGTHLLICRDCDEQQAKHYAHRLGLPSLEIGTDPKTFSDDLLVKCIEEAQRRHQALAKALGPLVGITFPRPTEAPTTPAATSCKSP